ncbi:MAG: UDP-glucose 4-epimerase GalE [Bacteroidetes bacterium]|nr:UDP-glucose 4-epimerase GalE [Bacteroidota bacterium]MBU1114710.1 UDP-glucose 4-epimerase GalE [Bacteroidota bacterium]MBU1798912.1 UDP-glucose 4-epimerase GalE [Bacteroidota bacterium]
MKILVTGGVGYIGSHTVIQLIEANYEVVIVDNLSNSKFEALKRVEKITNSSIKFYKTDLLEKDALDKIFANEKIDAVIHFAGLKAVGESVEIPLHYYQNNISGTLNLLEVMQKNSVKKIVFSSSATVYGDPHKVPIDETFPLSATNPYGRSKLMIEEILRDLYKSNTSWDILILRYFNPIGAHSSGMIGEDPNGIPNNLIPYIAQVAVGKRDALSVFGNDYPTHDGTGVRDYIHVVDLADGHLRALEKLQVKPGCLEFNLGTGKGYSVLDVVKAFEKASNKKIAYNIVERRAGDIAKCYANPILAKMELNWEAKFGIDKMCEDSWRWQSKNPNGYK